MGNVYPPIITHAHNEYESFVLNQLKIDFEVLLSSLSNRSQSRLVILAKKSSMTATLIHAAFKNNIPYIPVDIDQPIKRINEIIDQIQPTAIFIDTLFSEFNFLSKNNTILWQSENYQLIKTDFPLSDSPVELASVLFTSGSTGIPKGVMISRQNINVFIEWMIREFHIDRNTRILSVSPFHFDLSIFDLYAVTEAQATLFFPEEKMIMNPLYLVDYIATHRINTIYATPTWFHLLISFGKTQRYNLDFVKTILIAGESLQETIALKLHETFPNATISNLYGPTETNVCTYLTLDFDASLPVRHGIVSIGSICPYADTKRTHEGVLFVNGASVMLGYWPILADKRGHDTGDIVEYDRENDLYYFVARADRMIKRHGYRIEPAEIEACILSFEGIAQAAVTATKEDGQIIITAHISPSMIDIEKLITYCKTFLPAYMLPDEYKQHETMPSTSNGKMDYNTLKNDGK
jgi:acyl-coenzyme A synthetase/AMP-(fatty) acid ligase